jgi:hypothetical protein
MAPLCRKRTISLSQSAASEGENSGSAAEILVGGTEIKGIRYPCTASRTRESEVIPAH